MKIIQENTHLIETLKELSAYDFILGCVNFNNNKTNDSVIYTAKQLQALYPKLFSKYKLDQAIKNENLPYFKSGRERYFIKSEIETWVKNKNRSLE